MQLASLAVGVVSVYVQSQLKHTTLGIWAIWIICLDHWVNSFLIVDILGREKRI